MGHKTRIVPVTRSFFEFARLARPRRPRRGIQAVQWTRHLFREHCRATPAPMSHLRIAGGIHQPSMGTVPGSGPAERARGKPQVRAAIGISAPFRVGSGQDLVRSGEVGHPRGDIDGATEVIAVTLDERPGVHAHASGRPTGGSSAHPLPATERSEDGPSAIVSEAFDRRA